MEHTHPICPIDANQQSIISGEIALISGSWGTLKNINLCRTVQQLLRWTSTCTTCWKVFLVTENAWKLLFTSYVHICKLVAWRWYLKWSWHPVKCWQSQTAGRLFSRSWIAYLQEYTNKYLHNPLHLSWLISSINLVRFFHHSRTKINKMATML